MRSLRLALLFLSIVALSGCTITNPDKPHGPASLSQPNTRDVPAPLDKMATTSAQLVGLAAGAKWDDANTRLREFSAAWSALTRRGDVLAPPSLRVQLDQNLTAVQNAIDSQRAEVAGRAASALNGSVEAYLAGRLSLGASALREIDYFGRQMNVDVKFGDWTAVNAAAVAMQFIWARIYSQSLGIAKSETKVVDDDLTMINQLIARKSGGLLQDAVADLLAHTDRLRAKLVT